MFIQFFAPFFLVFVFFLILALFGKQFARHITRVPSQQLYYGFALGYVIWALLLFVSPNHFVNSLINLTIVVAGLLSIRNKQQYSPLNLLKKIQLVRLLPMVVLALLWTIPVFFSGWKKDGAMVFYGVNAHDGVWHMALMETLASTPDRVLPTFSAYNLEGYHYLVDLTGSELVRQLGMNSQDLVFRVYPLLFGFFALYGATTLTLSLLPSKFELNQKKIFLLEFFSGMLLIGGGSLAYVLPMIGLQQSVNESAFWMHQNISTWVNLPLGVSFSLFIATLNLSILVYRKPRVINVSILGLMSGAHLGFKAYGGVLLLFGGLFTGAWLLKKRFIMHFIIFVTVCSASFLVVAFSALGSPQSAGLKWNPGWLVKTMFEAPDRLNFPRWELKRQDYEAHSNTLGLSGLWIAGVIIFILGNMGSRLFGLFGLITIKSPEKVLWIVLITTAMLIPLFFTQSGVAWNTIQFGYYAYLLLTPLVVVASAQIKSGLALAIMTCLLAFPTSIFTLKGLISSETSGTYSVSNSNLHVLKQLKQLDDGVVLAPYEDKAIVPALSGKSCFFCNETQSNLLKIASNNEKEQVNKLFDEPISTEEIRTFMQRNDIAYLYIPQEHINVDEQVWNASRMQKILSSGYAAVYTFKP